MTAFTPTLNLYMPGGGSLSLGGQDEVADIDRLNENFQKIDDFATGWGTPAERNQQFFGLAAGMDLLTGMKIGDTYQESDGSRRKWQYDGANWVIGENGMFLIRPDAANLVRATVDSSGAVALDTPSGQWSEIRNIFSSRYRNYFVEFYFQGGGVGTAFLRMMKGSDSQLVANSYTNSGLVVSNATTITPYYNVNNFGYVNGSTGTIIAGEMKIHEPVAADKPTTVDIESSAGGLMNRSSVLHSSAGAVSSDGLSLSRNGSALQGTVKIYGLA